MKKFAMFAIVSTSPLFLAACAGNSSMNAGQRISERGSEIGSFGRSWNEGQKDVTKGRKMLAKGNDRSSDGEKRLADARNELAKAEAQIEQAERDKTEGAQLIAGGTAQMQRAESDYAAIKAGPSAVGDTPLN